MFDGFVPIGTISAVVVVVPAFFIISIFLFKNNKTFARLLSIFAFVAVLVGIGTDISLFSKQNEIKKEKKIPAFNKDTTTYKEDLEEDSLKIKKDSLQKDSLRKDT